MKLMRMYWERTPRLGLFAVYSLVLVAKTLLKLQLARVQLGLAKDVASFGRFSYEFARFHEASTQFFVFVFPFSFRFFCLFVFFFCFLFFVFFLFFFAAGQLDQILVRLMSYSVWALPTSISSGLMGFLEKAITADLRGKLQEALHAMYFRPGSLSALVFSTQLQHGLTFVFFSMSGFCLFHV